MERESIILRVILVDNVLDTEADTLMKASAFVFCTCDVLLHLSDAAVKLCPVKWHNKLGFRGVLRLRQLTVVAEYLICDEGLVANDCDVWRGDSRPVKIICVHAMAWKVELWAEDVKPHVEVLRIYIVSSFIVHKFYHGLEDLIVVVIVFDPFGF